MRKVSVFFLLSDGRNAEGTWQKGMVIRSRAFISYGEQGPGIVKPFEDKMRIAMEKGLVDYLPRHRVDELITENGA